MSEKKLNKNLYEELKSIKIASGIDNGKEPIWDGTVIRKPNQHTLENMGLVECCHYYYFLTEKGKEAYKNYRPEPEFVDLEIVQNTDRADKWLGVHGALLASYDFVDLHCLPSLPKFVGFHYDKETTARLEDVANLMDLKETVYARLRK